MSAFAPVSNPNGGFIASCIEKAKHVTIREASICKCRKYFSTHVKYNRPQKSASKNHMGPIVLPLLYTGEEFAVSNKYNASDKHSPCFNMEIIKAMVPNTKYGYTNVLMP